MSGGGRFGLSLSFLDLITCGFGGVTLVFLILLALQGRLTDDSAVTRPGEGKAAISPFLIAVEIEAGEAPWTGPRSRPWVVSPDSPEDRIRVNSGPRQAAYAASRPPAPGATIRLGPLAFDARFRVHALVEGRIVTLNHQSPADWGADREGRILLWPQRRLSALDREASR